MPQTTSTHQRPIPRTGERLPVIGLGTWQTFDVGPNAPERAELTEVMRRFAAQGGRVVDSSPMYGQAERVVGDVTGDLNARERLFFATKVWTSGRDAGIRQMETSLKLMRAGTMDLMQVHNLLDLDTHSRTLRDWKAAGRIRYLGITHYHAGAHADLERLLKTREWDFAQFNYSLAEPEAEARLLPACAELGVAVIVNRPFAEGALFRRVKGRELPSWAAEIDCASWAQFFLKWIVSHPAVTCAIPGTSRVVHLEDNLKAGLGRLPDAAMRRRMAQELSRS
ncbi:MAG TPA: aldo/keto reductase [Burkholderiales bacterium]|jgi:aryl-alcohol dehydrogenase-like predicted oxidoreductase|nr:aldo/keto reductase [Burkholderiales bacterium]